MESVRKGRMAGAESLGHGRMWYVTTTQLRLMCLEWSDAGRRGEVRL